MRPFREIKSFCPAEGAVERASARAIRLPGGWVVNADRRLVDARPTVKMPFPEATGLAITGAR